MTRHIETLRIKLFKNVQKIKIIDLISISLVGSFQYSKELSAVNDVDLIVLVKELTPHIFKQINSKFKVLADKLATPKIKFVVENRTAPLKPGPVKGKKIVQLHLLIYDLDLWQQ